MKKFSLKRVFILLIIAMLASAVVLAEKAGYIEELQKALKSMKVKEFISQVKSKIVDKVSSLKPAPKKEEEQVEVVSEATPVKVYKTKRMNFKDTLPVMGTIRGYKEVQLKFETSGVLESFNFEEGERIQEGDIVANLNQRDALLKLKYAELEVEKTNKLFDVGGIDRIKLEQAKLEYESAKSDFEKTNIYAVSDGILGSRDADVGSYLTPNDAIGTFVEIEDVYAVFDVIEKDSPKLKLGQKTEIFVDAYPNKSYKGTVDSISPIVEGRTRTQNIKIELRNPDFKLKPGMFARALISTYEKDNALTMPTSAFKKKEAEYFAYVIHKDEKDGAEAEKTTFETGSVEVRKIEIGYLTQDIAEVAKGLGEGELIIVEAFQEFKDKEKVEISEVQETIF